MTPQESLLVILVKLVDCIPMPRPPSRRGPGHPKVYSDRLFLKALVIKIVRHLHKVNELSVLRQETVEMQALRVLLTEQGRYPARRKWECRLVVPQLMCDNSCGYRPQHPPPTRFNTLRRLDTK